MIFTYTDFLQIAPRIIKGQVVSSEHGLPLEEVLVYTIKGREEVKTDQKGLFTFNSWQPFPITITLEKCGYQSRILTLYHCTSKLYLELKKIH